MESQNVFSKASSVNLNTSSPDSGSAPQPKKKSRRGGDGPQKRRCNSTLQILIEAILNASEDEVPDIVRRIRTCDSLDVVAQQILRRETPSYEAAAENDEKEDEYPADQPLEGERELARKMGELRLENGSVRFIGGTSNLIYVDLGEVSSNEPESDMNSANEDPVTSWTRVTKDKELIAHLLNMYFNYHYTYFTTMSKTLFYQDFFKGKHGVNHSNTVYCSPLLVNAILSLGAHFTSVPGAYGTPGDSRTKGEHFFAEAKRLIVENDEFERPKLTTVQALAIMSVREAGCAREAKGWVYSGMAFRMAQDLGLNYDDGGGTSTDKKNFGEQAVDARRITFWGCFLFDKAWSNYLGRLPQIPKNSYNVPKYDVFPNEDAELWSPYTDAGSDHTNRQPSRTRAVGLQFSTLCEISSDLLLFFYHPNHIGRSSGKAVELKKLSELHRRLEDWRKELPQELEPREGQLPHVILLHMFFHLQYIHLFRPFLKYTPAASPLPSHVSPRRICTANAGAMSKLMRLYKKSWNLRQICNIAVYMIHSACTIHLLNLPEKTAKRDIIHGVKHLEEIAEDWPCARRTLSIISVLARKWNVELPEEASAVLQRTDEKYGHYSTSDVPTPRSNNTSSPSQHSVAHIPTTTETDSFSPITQFSQPPVSQADLSPSDIIMGSASLAQISGAGPPTQSRAADNVSNMGMTGESLGGSGLSAGLAQNIYQQQAPQRFTPLNSAQGNALSTSQAGVPAARVSTGQVFQGLDQDWFLNDGAKWHQNFEAWNMPGSMPTNDQMFMFADNNNGMPPRQSSEDTSNASNFDNLSTLTSNGWLPGLD
ncbi:Nitrogen assimilation transcription factor nit-4 [Colletotrichum sp. SAR 10_70]|nr:Nitrogen assimilation transcription factor nit-4 [Colletotrichum sp. SAR 10_71]KAI8162964.1 Nitrogen assimilation transcription factor nit-4 [Colletotrichum sp. SAR 10_70]